ncbi:MAG: hypothetical protein J6J61_02890 [Muribaculaceae bacterium]|nr:hypothetical protein [Muribaculaceae bacterium]
MTSNIKITELIEDLFGEEEVQPRAQKPITAMEAAPTEEQPAQPEAESAPTPD